MTSSGEQLHYMWRIIDANLNRIGEGLRFLEEVARFLLNDAFLTQQLKYMRHDMVRADWLVHQQLLQARDSESDVGTKIGTPEEEKRKELPILVVANARRVQESLRVLEELAKIPGTAPPPLEAKKFEEARFTLYTIERVLLSKLKRRDKIGRLSGLYVIIDTQILGERSPIETASQAIRGGARTIQLRNKLQDRGELLPVARQLQNLCTENGALFIVNDHLDLALAINADGLHLGQKDLPVRIARKLMPFDMILGSSTTTVEQAIAAESDGADYIAAGSIYPTKTKEIVTVIGLDRLRQIRQAITSPLVAIGGINKDNAADVIAAGANSVAVISAALATENVEEASRQIFDRVEVRT